MREPIPLRSWLNFLSYACISLGFGLVLAGSFQEGRPRQIFAGAGLATLVLGALIYLAINRFRPNLKIKNWTGPAAVAFILGGPILMVLIVMAISVLPAR